MKMSRFRIYLFLFLLLGILVGEIHFHSETNAPQSSIQTQISSSDSETIPSVWCRICQFHTTNPSLWNPNFLIKVCFVLSQLESFDFIAVFFPRSLFYQIKVGRAPPVSLLNS